jgi:hypothetical protein
MMLVIRGWNNFILIPYCYPEGRWRLVSGLLIPPPDAGVTFSKCLPALLRAREAVSLRQPVQAFLKAS